MKKRNMPAIPEASPRPGVLFDLSPRVLEQWNHGLRAEEDAGTDNVINIYDVIGFDWWTGTGVTAKKIDAQLRRVGRSSDIEVNINSPGGDVFEGLAIYNLLREHKGHVRINVLGLAASAASFIAMAGDDIRIARAAFFMVHNAWVGAVGDRNLLREVADWLEPFDRAIADIYHVRTEIEAEELRRLMDVETWIGGKEAVEKGWADDLLDSDLITSEEDEDARAMMSVRILDIAMAKAGMPRSQRREHLSNVFKSGTHDAAGGGTPGAAVTDTRDAVEIDVSPTRRIAFPF